MNFLSHFYFDRESTDPDRTLGMVLPDLVKNARKDWCLRPERQPHLFVNDRKMHSVLEGWNRHLAVDRYFHSSAFFLLHTQKIKELIGPHLVRSVVRPSFVAHIALELMLDNLLLSQHIIKTEEFYRALAEADKTSLRNFLILNHISDPTPFFSFLDEFISSAYLNDYRDESHIIYALGRICMRVWIDPFTDAEKIVITPVLINYLHTLRERYMDIFHEIEEKLTPYTLF